MTISPQRFFVLIIGLLFCVLGCTREHVDLPTLDDHTAPMETHETIDVEVAFAQNLMPILTARCALSGCHVADGPHGLDFRTYESFVAGGEHGPVFIAGNADESKIVEEIVESNMPPPPRDPLTAAEIQLFKDWINQQEATGHVVQDEHDEHDEHEDADDDHDDMDDEHDEHDDDMDDDHDDMDDAHDDDHDDDDDNGHDDDNDDDDDDH